MPLVTIEKRSFGKTSNNVAVDQFILKNQKGMEVRIINYGGIITSWKVKDKNNVYKNIVLGYDSLAAYEVNSPYLGAIVGRYANRIAEGTFSIDGETYRLALNNGSNHLHGGIKGFDKVVWQAKEVIDETTASVVLRYRSSDMEEGYPGNLEVSVTYTLNNHDELCVAYAAETDKKTIVNLTQHSYFNLTADFNTSILNHDVVINADTFLPVDTTQIPTGEFRSVAGTPFDFRTPKSIGNEINASDQQLVYGHGYDHCWVRNGKQQESSFIASAYEPTTGRFLEVFSDAPGIQFYTGNFLNAPHPDNKDNTYAARSGFCFETQEFPNAPNQQNFLPVLLHPGQQYETATTFKFYVK